MTPSFPDQFRQALLPDDFDFIKQVESELTHGDLVRIVARLILEEQQRLGEFPEGLTVEQVLDRMNDQITAIAMEYQAEMSAIDEEARDV